LSELIKVFKSYEYLWFALMALASEQDCCVAKQFETQTNSKKSQAYLFSSIFTSLLSETLVLPVVLGDRKLA
jgi:hypothetical protein